VNSVEKTMKQMQMFVVSVLVLNKFKHQINHQLKSIKNLLSIYTNQERNQQYHTRMLELFYKDLMLRKDKITNPKPQM
jgi:hypothetical protein